MRRGELSADLTAADLDGATYDTRTTWPAGFDPIGAGAKETR